MKSLKSLFVASLALASSVAASAGVSAQAWIETYYLDPRPSELPHAVNLLSREGYFDKPGQTALAVGFLATVFAQNPEQVDVWLKQLQHLPQRHQRLIASALWQAGHPRGSAMLMALSGDASNRADVVRLAQRGSSPIADTVVLSTSSMNLQWGAFLASGDERHVLNIFSALGTGHPGLDSAAKTSLARAAVAHPRVLEICRVQLDRQPNEVREILRAAVNAAQPTRSSI